jgi:tetratricopeptide (TPR) repeat protein
MDGFLVYFIGFLLALALVALLIEGVRAFQERQSIRNGRYKDRIQCEQALGYYTKLLDRRPGDWVNYIKRAQAFVFLGDHNQAIRDYTRALALHPRDVQIFVLRSRSYYKLRKYDESIWDCTRALNINAEYVAAYAVRGQAYSASGEFEAAIRDYTRASELDPAETQYTRSREQISEKLANPKLQSPLRNPSGGHTERPLIYPLNQ